jgi:uncharacterized protein YhjY with autotransporter beta-barrel domain
VGSETLSDVAFASIGATYTYLFQNHRDRFSERWALAQKQGVRDAVAELRLLEQEHSRLLQIQNAYHYLMNNWEYGLWDEFIAYWSVYQKLEGRRARLQGLQDALAANEVPAHLIERANLEVQLETATDPVEHFRTIQRIQSWNLSYRSAGLDWAQYQDQWNQGPYDIFELGGNMAGNLARAETGFEESRLRFEFLKSTVDRQLAGSGEDFQTPGPWLDELPAQIEALEKQIERQKFEIELYMDYTGLVGPHTGFGFAGSEETVAGAIVDSLSLAHVTSPIYSGYGQRQQKISPLAALANLDGVRVLSDRWEISLNGFGLDGRMKDGFGGGTDYEIYGAAVSLNYGFGHGSSLGVTYTYSHADTEDRLNDNETIGESSRFTLQGAMPLGRAGYVAGAVSYGVTDYESERTIALLGTQAAGDFDGHDWSGAVEAGYGFFVESVAVTPSVSVNYSDSTVDAYLETGGGLVNNTVDESKTQSFKGAVGAQVERRFSVGEQSAITPQFRASVSHDFSDRDRISNISLVGVTVPVVGVRPQRTKTTIGSGIAADLGSGVGLVLQYDAEFAEDFLEHAVAGALRLNF